MQIQMYSKLNNGIQSKQSFRFSNKLFFFEKSNLITVPVSARKLILPRLLQRSKECRGHYSTIHHPTSQWIMRSDMYTSILLKQCEKIRAF